VLVVANPLILEAWAGSATESDDGLALPRECRTPALCAWLTAMCEGVRPSSRVAAASYRHPVLTVDPPKPVTVEQPDGTWPGWLSAWRRTDTGWRAYVAYLRGTGLNHVHWVEADRVRPDAPGGS